MDLYDDLDTKQRPGQIDGWSSGVKLLQTQLALKKAAIPTPQRRDFNKRSTILAPVMLMKSKKPTGTFNHQPGETSHHQTGDDIFKSEPHAALPATAANRKHAHHTAVPSHLSTLTTTTTVVAVSALAQQQPVHVHLTPSSKVFNDYDWDVVDEYDPLWPNEYEKLVKDRRDAEGHSAAEKHHRGGHHHNSHHGGGGGDRGYGDRKRRGAPFSAYSNRFEADGNATANKPFQFGGGGGSGSGFGGRPRSTEDDDDDEAAASSNAGPKATAPRNAGAAIAPPPSLQESTPIIPASAAAAAAAKDFGAGSVAAKIMAKYGFRDGQGLGKQEQGMSMALQVEKTSKRGGRIIHERESAAAAAAAALDGTASDGATTPPPSEAAAGPPAAASSGSAGSGSVAQQLMLPPSMIPPIAAAAATNKPGASTAGAPATPAEEPTITEIMKQPSKVVLLRNMVGPGDVDNDLEPEVKDECNTKYGDVVSVIINELQNVVPEEAVRIFVEFKRIESAIKAVVDLNGRFFGGRQVKAGFFGYDKYKAYQLYD